MRKNKVTSGWHWLSGLDLLSLLCVCVCVMSTNKACIHEILNYFLLFKELNINSITNRITNQCAKSPMWDKRSLKHLSSVSHR